MISGIFVGLSTIDLVYRVGEFPPPNTKTTAAGQDVYVGGPATNAAIAFRHLGGEAALVTGVGRHPMSNLIRQELQRYGVSLLDLSPRFDQLPVLSSVWVNAAGERNVVSANATRVTSSPPLIDESLCDRTSILLVDGHFMDACQAWAAAARARNKPVILDGGSWKPGTDALLSTVTTAICSADFRPPGCSSHADVLRYLQDRGVAQAAITRGDQSILAAVQGQTVTVAVPKVPLVDTMGAGDILHGAFCCYTAARLSFLPALEHAAHVATESCRYRGTREWMEHTPPCLR